MDSPARAGILAVSYYLYQAKLSLLPSQDPYIHRSFFTRELCALFTRSAFREQERPVKSAWRGSTLLRHNHADAPLKDEDATLERPQVWSRSIV